MSSSIRNSSYIVHKTWVKITKWGGLFSLIVRFLSVRWKIHSRNWVTSDRLAECWVSRMSFLRHRKKTYYKTKKFASLRYFYTCFVHNIGGVSLGGINLRVGWCGSSVRWRSCRCPRCPPCPARSVWHPQREGPCHAATSSWSTLCPPGPLLATLFDIIKNVIILFFVIIIIFG